MQDAEHRWHVVTGSGPLVSELRSREAALPTLAAWSERVRRRPVRDLPVDPVDVLDAVRDQHGA